MNGRSTNGTTGLGTVEVNGRSRVPSPPTRITACMRALAPSDAFVGEARGLDGLGGQRVASVDQDVAGHRAGDRAEVQLLELAPLGDEHDRVGAAHRLQRAVGELA